MLEAGAEIVELPQNPQDIAAELAAQDVQTQSEPVAEVSAAAGTASGTAVSTPKASAISQAAAAEQPPTRSETPSTQDLPSEAGVSTSPTTPSSVHPPVASLASSVTPNKPVKSTAPRTAVPALPLIPALPALPKGTPPSAKPAQKGESLDKNEIRASMETGSRQAGSNTPAVSKDVDSIEHRHENTQLSQPPASAPAPAPTKSVPKSWANLFAKTTTSATSVTPQSQADTNGGGVEPSSASAGDLSNFARANASSVAEVLQAFRIGNTENLAFLEPRGLTNTGNMCYMNSVSVDVSLVHSGY